MAIKTGDTLKPNDITLNSSINEESDNLLDSLVVFTEELLQTGNEQVSFQRILENILVISKAKCGVMTLQNTTTKKFTTVAVAGFENKLISATKILGFDPIGKEWPDYKVGNEKLKGQVVSHFSSLSELSGNVIPKVISIQLEKLLGVEEVIVMKIIVNNQMYGDITLMMPTSKHLQNKKLLEIYSRQIDMFITRIYAEKELNRSKEYFEMAFNNSPDAVSISRLEDGLFVNVNKVFILLSGYSYDEIIGKTSFELNLYKTIADRQKIVAELNQKGYCKNVEVTFCRKDGSKFIGSVSAEITLVHGVTYIYTSIRDITVRILEQEALKQSEEKYRSLIENSSDAIFCVDEKGEYQFTNHLFSSVFGKTPDYFIGKTFGDIYPKEHADYRFEATRRVFQTG